MMRNALKIAMSRADRARRILQRPIVEMGRVIRESLNEGRPSWLRKALVLGAYCVSYPIIVLISLPQVAHFGRDDVINTFVLSLIPAAATYVAVSSKADRARQFRVAFSWLPPLIGLFALPYFTFVSVHFNTFEGDFFSTAAQVIPVFLLALTVDVARSEHLNSSDLAWTALVGMSGEGTALAATAFDKYQGAVAFVIIASCLLSLFIALFLALGTELANKRVGGTGVSE